LRSPTATENYSVGAIIYSILSVISPSSMNQAKNVMATKKDTT